MKFIKNLKEQLCSFDVSKKKLFSSVLFLSIIYAVAFSSIFRANFNYFDDVKRAIEGYSISGGAFARHISNLLSWFIHTTDGRLSDISPLPQLIACVFLALAGVVAVKVVCKKITKYYLLATLPIGLSPYFLSCISYKFDAPYMALSILASVVPFLFMHKNRWIYASVSIVSLLIMTMSYQASSGIFVMMALYFFFRTILYKTDSIKNAFTFLGISVLSYCIALGIFQLCIFQQVDNLYVSASMQHNYTIFILFWHNISYYFTLIYNDWNVIWKITALVVITIFYVKTIILSKRNTVVAFLITTLFLTLLAGSIFGVYVLLEKPLFAPRAMYGTGIFLAILGMDICFSLKKILSFPVIVLSWCFIVFAFAYGNCLADQKRYNEFRMEILARDLSHILPEKVDSPYTITFINSIGFSPVVQNVACNNPIIERLIYVGLKSGYSFSAFSLSQYYKFHEFTPTLRRTLTTQQKEIPVVFDSYYHTIKKNDEEIVVVLKPK